MIGSLRGRLLDRGGAEGVAGEVLAHPQIVARGVVRQIDSPVGPLPTLESPLRLSDGPVAAGPLPALGGDTREVLREAGYSPEEIERLVEHEVVFPAPADRPS